jgi:hypothetical protein
MVLREKYLGGLLCRLSFVYAVFRGGIIKFAPVPAKKIKSGVAFFIYFDFCFSCKALQSDSKTTCAVLAHAPP